MKKDLIFVTVGYLIGIVLGQSINPSEYNFTFFVTRITIYLSIVGFIYCIHTYTKQIDNFFKRKK